MRCANVHAGWLPWKFSWFSLRCAITIRGGRFLAAHGNAVPPVPHEGHLSAVNANLTHQKPAQTFDDAALTGNPVVGARPWRGNLSEVFTGCRKNWRFPQQILRVLARRCRFVMDVPAQGIGQ